MNIIIDKCEHSGCNVDIDAPKEEYCDEHYWYRHCECCECLLEDAAGSPGDGICRGCD